MHLVTSGSRYFGRIAEQPEHMSLQLNLDAMSPDERARATTALNAALERVTRRK